MSYNILVLDDEKEIADLVELSLNNSEFNIYKFNDSQKARSEERRVGKEC